MANNKSTAQKREEALTQFKTAQTMLVEGQAELASAQEKIKRAHQLIERSADTIRQTWSATRPARLSKKTRKRQ